MTTARAHNPALGGWYRAVSTYDAKQYGPPAGAVEWVEYTKGRFPGPGLLHRAGSPDQKVEVLASAGCSMLPSGQRVCTVFAREMGPADIVRYQLPNGQQGRAAPHRLYQTPGGQLTSNPHVIQNVTTFKTAWLPASYDATKPAGIKGSWVQVSGQGTGATAVVHARGLGTQVAELKAVRPDTWGRLRAQVRWRQSPNPNGFRRSNASDQVALTTSVSNNDKWWCALIPGARGCVTQRVDNPAIGTPGLRQSCETDADCPESEDKESGCVPKCVFGPQGDWCSFKCPDPLDIAAASAGRPAPPRPFQVQARPGGTQAPQMPQQPQIAGRTGTTAGGRGSRLGSLVLNPGGVSAAADRAQVNQGSGIVAAIRRGAAKIVVDAQGVKLVAA